MKIGWGRADITPIGEICKKASLVGQFNERITETVRDPIFATALAIGDSIVVSLDLLSVPDSYMAAVRDKIKNLIPDFSPENLIMAATHIHTGPILESDLLAQWWGERFARLCGDPDVVTPDAYRKFAAERIASAAADAWNNRKSGGIAAAFGRVAVPHCRRVRYKDGSSNMYGNTNTPDFQRIEGGADTGVEYIAAFDEAGTMTGVVINLACTAQILEHQYYITADMWGELRRQWPECEYILPLCGASGDITMRDMIRRGRNEEIMNTVKGMEQQVGRILRESKFVLSELTEAEISYDAPVKHVTGIIPLPIRTVTDDEYIAAKAVYDEIENWLQTEKPKSEDSIPIPMAERTKYAVAAGVVNRYALQSEKSTVDMELHALRIGDTVIVTNPFELFQDFGMCMKARSPANQTLVTQLSCGYLGYLPTEYSVPGGGYSAGVYNGYIGPDGGDVLVERTLEFINKLF